MRKIIILFFIGSCFLVGLSGCGVKGPLTPPQEQPDESQTQFNS